VLRRPGPPTELVGQVTPAGEFLAGPEVTWLACLETATTEPIEYMLPDDLPPGGYALCITQEYAADACALINVTGGAQAGVRGASRG
jgi:hypothetical protein